MRPKICAIVVVYRPDGAALSRLLATLRDDHIFTVVVDNGGGAEQLSAGPSQSDFALVGAGTNLGLGAAINAGIEAARARDATHVVTFDQDSSPAPGMVQVLLEAWQTQTQRGVRVGALGPRLVDERQQPALVHPFVRLGVVGSGRRYCRSSTEVIVVDTLISSGCLMALEAWDAVGPMDAGYFVDYTDIEWCFRARSKGFVLLGVCAAQMTHELGHGKVRKLLGAINLIEYSPVRRYYYARNVLALAALGHVPLRWKFKLTLGLTLRLATLRWAPRARDSLLADERHLFWRGIRDALRGRRGQLR